MEKLKPQKAVIIIILLFIFFSIVPSYAKQLRYKDKPDLPIPFANSLQDIEIFFGLDTEVIQRLITQKRIILLDPGTEYSMEKIGFLYSKIIITSGPFKEYEGYVPSDAIDLKTEIAQTKTEIAESQNKIISGKKETKTPGVSYHGKNLRIEGITYDKNRPTVLIGSNIYQLNDSICGGKITEITPEKISIEFQNLKKEYRIGDLIEPVIDEDIKNKESISKPLIEAESSNDKNKIILEELQQIGDYIDKKTAISQEISVKHNESKTLFDRASKEEEKHAICSNTIMFMEGYKKELLKLSVPPMCGKLHSLSIKSIEITEEFWKALLIEDEQRMQSLLKAQMENSVELAEERGHLLQYFDDRTSGLVEGNSLKMPTYTVLNEDAVGTLAIKRVTLKILVSGNITEDGLKALLNRLCASIKDRYSVSRINILIFAFISKEFYESKMGQWIARLHKDFDDIEPTIHINEKQISQLIAVPEQKFGLSQDTRKQIWMELIRYEDNSEIEAMKIYPLTMEDVKNRPESFGRSQIQKQTEMQKRLEAEYKNSLANKYGLTPEQLNEIKKEGIEKDWPYPPYDNEKQNE